MDRAGKPSNQPSAGIESTGEPEKEKASGTTKTGKNVKPVSEEKKTSIVESHSSSTSLYQRTGEISEPTEIFLKKTDITDSVAASENMKSVSDKLKVSGQSDFESLLILADMDPLLGIGKASVASVKKELEKLNDYAANASKPESEHIAVKDNLVSEKTSRLLKRSYLFNLTRCLIKQMDNKNISLENVSKEVFKEELNILLKDMHSRGIGLSSKVRKVGSRDTEEREQSKHKFYASPKSYYGGIEDQNDFRLQNYNKHFSQLPEFDTKLEEFLNSDQCVKWDSNQPIYRGGDASSERKLLRNTDKGKTPFRSDLINRGNTLLGFGQYYTSNKRIATRFASKDKVDSPVVLTTFIKPGTPIIKHEELDGFFSEESQSNNGPDDLTWKDYLSYYCKQPIIVGKTYSPQGHVLTCTLPHGEVIDHVNMVAVGDFEDLEDFKAATDLSIHRLGEDRLILGHPDKFAMVNVPDKTEHEATQYVALGYTSGEPLPVKKCKLDGKTLYFVESPDNKDNFLLVKQLPESLKDADPTFILEPSGDFLFQRKKQKLDKLQTAEGRLELEQKADENIEIIRSYFNMINDNKEGT